eukprot:m.9223 g.9223  ORF g.9223 m.9223 type:complete len:445 (+) comp3437_c0_seq1:263-1597(+)
MATPSWALGAVVATLAISMLVHSAAGAACKCDQKVTYKTSYNHRDTVEVIVGKVTTKLEKKNAAARFIVKAEQVFKGCSKVNDKIIIHTPEGPLDGPYGSCGASLKVKSTYILFIKYVNGARVVGGACLKNSKIKKVKKKHLKWLKKQAKKLPECDIFGQPKTTKAASTKQKTTPKTTTTTNFLDRYTTKGNAPLGPTKNWDLTVDRQALADTVELDYLWVSSQSCELEELCVEAPGFRKLLRFDAVIANIGSEDLQLGTPGNNGIFEYSMCHGHYHALEVATYQLQAKNSYNVIARGHKQSFCLRDDRPYGGSGNSPTGYTCSNQGISAGWSDVYYASLSCQWIDVTDVADGEYRLLVTVDPNNFLGDPNPSNNVADVPIVIKGGAVSSPIAGQGPSYGGAPDPSRHFSSYETSSQDSSWSSILSSSLFSTSLDTSALTFNLF